MQPNIFLSVLLICFVNIALADEKIKVGVPVALSGNAATYGTDIKNGLLFANEILLGGRYEFVFEDDKCNGKDAVTVAQKLVNIDKVRYVIGFACSGTLLASAPIYEKAKVVAITPSGSAPKISEAGDYIFRNWPSDVGTARVLYDYVAKHHKTIGIITEQTEYAQGLEDAFLANNSGDTLRVHREGFLTADADFRTPLLKLKSAGIDSLFINSQTETTFANVLKQVKELKFSVQIYGAYWPGSSALQKLAGSTLDGVIYSDLPDVDALATSEGKQILKDFVAKYGKPQTWEIIVGFSIEALRALDQALKSGQDVREYFYKTEFNGIFGKWHFDPNGDIVGVKHAIKRIEGGLPVEIR